MPIWWYSLQPFVLFYGHSVHFLVILYTFSRFGMFFSRKNLATLQSIPVDAVVVAKYAKVPLIVKNKRRP
jgi:hypothetical protein